QAQDAQALQGRGQGSPGRPGMRHGLRELRGHPRRRRHRMLPRRAGQPHAVRRAPRRKLQGRGAIRALSVFCTLRYTRSMPEEPLRTTTFLLGRADALAYEQAAGRMTPIGVLLLLLWLAAWGGGATFIPDDWAGARFGLSSVLLISVAVAIGYVLV